MNDFRSLTEHMLASPQIEISDVTVAKERGVTLIINNRPEGEAPDQTPGAAIEQAAEDAGLGYLAIPVDHSGFSPEQIGAMRQALGEAEGTVLAYCRSGTRSTFLWALARASSGAAPDELIKSAAGAGYDLAPLRGTLEQLAARAEG